MQATSNICKAPKKSSHWQLAHFALVLGAVLLVWGCGVGAQTAEAKDYDMPSVSMDATVQTNGNLHVVEQRTFEFDGTFSCVWWELGNLPNGSSLQVAGVSVTVNNKTTKLPSTAFNLKWRDSGGPSSAAYSVDVAENAIYVFSDFDDVTAVVTLDYTVVDGVQRYADQGELYWKFVGDGWGEDSENVNLTVHLPVAADATVTAGENVRAWGHGPLNANVSINEQAGTVEYTVPEVESGQYAEARVLFPASWLSGVQGTDTNAHPNEYRLDKVVSEEQVWADQANAERMGQLIALLVSLLMAIVAIGWALFSFMRYGKELKPTFTDTYWRDDPEPGVHPAVIGRLIRFDSENSKDFITTIMHLVQQGSIHLNMGTYQQNAWYGSKQVQEYYLTRMRDAECALTNEIDIKTMSILFDVVGQGREQIWLSELKLFAEANPKRFNLELEEWQGLVEAATMREDFFESYSKAKQGLMVGVGLMLFIVGLVLGVILDSIFTVGIALVVCIVLMVISTFMSRRTQRGADANARAEALKKWLEDFTALDERPPSDVIVWGKYMVYAHLFGIADKVLHDLRGVMPELFDDTQTQYTNTYVPWWVVYSSNWGTINGFETALDQTFTDSMQAVASALGGSSSSGIGGGGGFSGGGGGGFGGGGGGAR